MPDDKEARGERVMPAAPAVPRDADSVAAAQRTAKALADAESEAQARQADETVEGGKYKVGDDFVDAEGKPIKAK
jgi:hypothetical protein